MFILSKNAVGLVVLAFSVFGLEVTEQGILDLLSAIGTIISFGVLVYNQITRKDVAGFFFKK